MRLVSYLALGTTGGDKDQKKSLVVKRARSGKTSYPEHSSM